MFERCSVSIRVRKIMAIMAMINIGGEKRENVVKCYSLFFTVYHLLLVVFVLLFLLEALMLLLSLSRLRRQRLMGR